MIKNLIAVDGCANGFPDMNLITTKASRGTSQAQIVTANSVTRLNTFTCGGTLFSLLLGVDVRTETATRNLYPEIVLLKRRQTDSSAPIFQEVRGSARTVKLTAANFSTSGVFEYALDPPLDFQNSHILGWKQPELARSVVRMYTIFRQGFSRSSDDDSQGSNNALLLYPIAGKACSAARDLLWLTILDHCTCCLVPF